MDMNSGSTGSTQSSSGGDEEYESSSRGGAGADSFPPVFHHQHNHQGYPPAGHVTLAPLSAHPPPPSSYFDPLASYLNHSNPNPVLNLEPGWPKDVARSAPLTGASTSQPQSQLVTGSSTADLQPNQSGGGGGGGGGGRRNPKKRTRALTRAPTTVLTTDTSNFRAMVQEFTGIPASPFGSSVSSSSLLFPRNLFVNRRVGGGGAGGSCNPLVVDPPAPLPFPPYLLRPFAQKNTPIAATLPPPLPFISSTTTDATTTPTAGDSSGHYQIPPSDLVLLTTIPANLSFSSILHPPGKYPPTDRDSNPDPGSFKPSSSGSMLTRPQLRAGLMEELGHDHHDQLSGLTGSLAASGADAGAAGSRSGNGGIADHSHHLRLGNDGNASAVESWICTSADRLA